MISGRIIEDWGTVALGGGNAEISICCSQPSKETGANSQSRANVLLAAPKQGNTGRDRSETCN